MAQYSLEKNTQTLACTLAIFLLAAQIFLTKHRAPGQGVYFIIVASQAMDNFSLPVNVDDNHDPIFIA